MIFVQLTRYWLTVLLDVSKLVFIDQIIENEALCDIT